MYLGGILLHYFIQKKSVAKAHRILVETFDDHALSVTTGKDWFRRLKKMMISMLKIKNALAHLKSLKMKNWTSTSWRLVSDVSWTCRIIRSWSNNSFETFESIRNASKARILGAIQVEAESHWTASCHVWTAALTAEKKSSFLHRIVTGDEKWIHYDSPKRRRSW